MEQGKGREQGAGLQEQGKASNEPGEAGRAPPLVPPLTEPASTAVPDSRAAARRSSSCCVLGVASTAVRGSTADARREADGATSSATGTSCGWWLGVGS